MEVYIKSYTRTHTHTHLALGSVSIYLVKSTKEAAWAVFQKLMMAMHKLCKALPLCQAMHQLNNNEMDGETRGENENEERRESKEEKSTHGLPSPNVKHNNTAQSYFFLTKQEPVLNKCLRLFTKALFEFFCNRSHALSLHKKAWIGLPAVALVTLYP